MKSRSSIPLILTALTLITSACTEKAPFNSQAVLENLRGESLSEEGNLQVETSTETSTDTHLWDSAFDEVVDEILTAKYRVMLMKVDSTEEEKKERLVALTEDRLKAVQMDLATIELYDDALKELRSDDGSLLLHDNERLRIAILGIQASESQGALQNISALDLTMLIRRSIIDHENLGQTKIEALREAIKEIFKMGENEISKIIN